MSIISGTLVSGCIPTGKLEKRYTSGQIAHMLGVSQQWVRDASGQGLIEPCDGGKRTLGMVQYPRSALLRLSAFQALQSVCGRGSGIPKQIVLRIAPEIDRLCAKPELFPGEAEVTIRKAITDVLWSDDVAAQTFNRLAAISA